MSAAMIFGFDAARDLEGPRLLGTVIFGAVMLVLLGVAGFSKRLVLDRGERNIAIQSSFFSVAYSTQNHEIPPGSRVIVQDVEIMKTAERSDGRSGMLAGFLTARTHLYRLFLDVGDERIKLEETTYPEEINETGKGIADFLGLRCDTEAM
jgi:hypothetical protein